MSETPQVVYHAQCPHCATVQKISHQSLQQHQGLVVCRRCQASYPAKGHLLTPQQLQQLMQQVAKLKAAQQQTEQASSTPLRASHASSDDDDEVLNRIFNQLAADAEQPLSVDTTANERTGRLGEPQQQPIAHIAQPTPTFRIGKKSGLFAKLLSQHHATAEHENTHAAPTDSTQAALSSAIETAVLDKRPVSEPSLFSSRIQDFGKSALVFELPGDLNQYHLDSAQANKPVSEPILARRSLHELLTQKQVDTASHTVLTNAEVSTPDYDTSKQWFTQLSGQLNTANLPLSVTQPAPDEHDDEQDIKRLHEPSRSSTVAMRLPENSMLVFTLEDDGVVRKKLSFIDIQERLPSKALEAPAAPPVIQINQQHNEHTVWTVANIVAILILIIQMFYYFLMLSP